MKYEVNQNKKYHTYPNSGTVRSQALATIRSLNTILALVPEGVNVPPWVLMKVSQASESVKAVEDYISYYGDKSNLS